MSAMEGAFTSDTSPKVKVMLHISDKEYIPWVKRKNYAGHHTNGEGFVNYVDAETMCKDLPDLHVFMHDSGMIATHNIPCPVCHTEHAIFVTSVGFIQPCSTCSGLGYFLGKRVPKKWYQFWKEE